MFPPGRFGSCFSSTNSTGCSSYIQQHCLIFHHQHCYNHPQLFKQKGTRIDRQQQISKNHIVTFPIFFGGRGINFYCPYVSFLSHHFSNQPSLHPQPPCPIDKKDIACGREVGSTPILSFDMAASEEPFRALDPGDASILETNEGRSAPRKYRQS